MTDNAIHILEGRLSDLTKGTNSIPAQKENLEKERAHVEKLEESLARDELSLSEVQAALMLLKSRGK